ncbi:MAG: glycosyltransferase family 39 protein [Xenococcaceae cyanobacterium MO_234.B1]|nr:glycosyltransferase family 39 protein [Xenococcaceae cyanobacterium MO_234.B1]
MMNQKKLLLPLQIILIIFLLLGIYIRFNNLDTKIYWNDEVFTSLRISGYTETDITQKINTGQIISNKELFQYQYPNPNKSLKDTLNSLAVEGAQHPPFYFVLLRFWVQLFGNSITTIRSFSAFLSILNLPAIYLLCKELFKSPKVGWIATILIAVSPFHFLYAQAARQYSLWSLLTLLSSWALLRAIRIKNKFSWAIYATTSSLNIYTFPFSLFTIVGQGAYITIIENFKLTKITKNYVFSVLFVAVSFIPWFLYALLSLSHVKTTTSWLNYSLQYGIPQLIYTWFNNITRLFLDLENSLSLKSNELFPYISFPYVLAVIGIAALVVYSLYFLYANTSKLTWLFIFILIAITFLPLMIPDLMFEGRRSAITRYLLPAYLGIQIAVAHLFAIKLSTTNRLQKLYQTSIVLILSLGIFSCFHSSAKQVWWNNGPSKIGQIPIVAPIINRASQPLIISDRKWGDILALSHEINPQVKFKLLGKSLKIHPFPDGFSDVFLYSPSEQLRNEMKEKYNYQFEPTYEDRSVWLWSVTTKGNKPDN